MATMRERCTDEEFQTVIDKAETVAVVLRDMENGWPRRELHVSPATALSELRAALSTIGASQEELTEVFGSD